MIHAAAQTDLPADIAFTEGVVARTREALWNGAPIFCDSTMVATGIIRSRLPNSNEVICHLGDPRLAEMGPGYDEDRGGGRPGWRLEARGGHRQCAPCIVPAARSGA